MIPTPRGRAWLGIASGAWMSLLMLPGAQASPLPPSSEVSAEFLVDNCPDTPFTFIRHRTSDPLSVDIGANTLNSDVCDNPAGVQAAGASANVFTGRLAVHATSSGVPSTGFATARLEEVLRVQPFSGQWAGPVPTTFTMDVTGLLSGDARAGASLRAGFTEFFGREIGGEQDAACWAGGLFIPSRPQCVALSAASEIAASLSVTVNATQANPDIPFRALLSAGAEQTGFANLSRSAFLSVSLPPGFTFISSSGVFLSQAPELPPDQQPPDGSVPLPGTGALLLAALFVRFVRKPESLER